jgi:hypothetical protein
MNCFTHSEPIPPRRHRAALMVAPASLVPAIRHRKVYALNNAKGDKPGTAYHLFRHLLRCKPKPPIFRLSEKIISRQKDPHSRKNRHPIAIWTQDVDFWLMTIYSAL